MCWGTRVYNKMVIFAHGLWNQAPTTSSGNQLKETVLSINLWAQLLGWPTLCPSSKRGPSKRSEVSLATHILLLCSPLLYIKTTLLSWTHNSGWCYSNSWGALVNWKGLRTEEMGSGLWVGNYLAGWQGSVTKPLHLSLLRCKPKW